MKKLKIGFVGPYCTSNVGDWAMLINNICDFGHHEYFIFTYSSKFPHDMLNYYCNKEKYETIEVKIDKRCKLSPEPIPSDCLACISNLDELTGTIKKLDLMIVSGGGFVNDFWCQRTDKFYKIMAPLLIANKYKIPVRFMSQTIGPVNTTRDMMISFFNYLKGDVSISIRDNYCSPVYLNMITNHKNNYLPDDLCHINNCLLGDVNNDKNNKPYIVIIVKENLDKIKRKTKIFKNFCDSMRKLYKVDIVFLSFDLYLFGEEQSIYLNKHIKSKIVKIGKNRKFIPINEIANVINNAQMIITERYHASLFAFQFKTPFIVKLDEDYLTYEYNKAYGIISDFFNNIIFDEKDFIFYEWNQLFKTIVNNYNSILLKQKAIFASSNYKQNIKSLRKKRISYINSLIK